MYLTIKNYLFVPQIRSTLEKISKNCLDCTCNKITKHKYGHVIGNLSSRKLNEAIYIDHLGPFNPIELNIKTKTRKIWFLVIT